MTDYYVHRISLANGDYHLILTETSLSYLMNNLNLNKFISIDPFKLEVLKRHNVPSGKYFDLDVLLTYLNDESLDNYNLQGDSLLLNTNNISEVFTIESFETNGEL